MQKHSIGRIKKSNHKQMLENTTQHLDVAL